MGLILELVGGRGAGKSTLIKRIKERYDDCYSIEGYRKMDTGYDLRTSTGFVENERLYIRRSIEECKSAAASDGMTIITCGPREILFYLEYCAAKYYPHCKILEAMENDIDELRKVYSPNVMYLHASDYKLRENISKDKNKFRRNIDFWIEFSHYLHQKIKTETCPYFVDTNNLTADEVAEIAIRHITELRNETHDSNNNFF